MQRLQSKRASKGDLEHLYSEVEKLVGAKFEDRFKRLEAEVERLESEVERLDDEVDEQKETARVWRNRYFKEQQVSEEFRGALSLAMAEVRELKTVLKDHREVIQKQKSRISDLLKIVHGEKSEVSKVTPTADALPKKRSRGRQYGAKGYGRKRHLELQQVEKVHEFEGSERFCQCCGLPYEEIGEKTSEEIDVEVRVQVIRHRRKTMRKTCKCPGVPTIKTPPAPAKLFRGSAYSVGFWHHVIFDKFHLQRPTNRTCKQLQSYGLDLGSSVIVNGLKKLYSERIFKVLVDEITNRIRSSNRQQKDETGWKVFQEIDGKKGHQHWLWVTRTDDCCLFELRGSRSREAAKRTIGETPVIVTSDMLKVYDDLGDNVTNSWCWAHVRRYLLKLGTRPNLTQLSERWVSKVDWLYHCNNSRLSATGDEFQLHDRNLRAAMAEFKRFAKSHAQRSKDPEAKKVFKMIAEHWEGLALFVDCPAVPMDNNLSEQALRNAIVGRKCYYGSGSSWSGDLAADLFTIFATVEMNGMNPRTWLLEYLTAVAKNDGRVPAEYLNFLPWNSPPPHLLSN